MPFESFLSPQRSPDQRKRPLAIAGAVALHALLGAGALASSFWHVDELSPPLVAITLVPPPAPQSEVRRSEARSESGRGPRGNPPRHRMKVAQTTPVVASERPPGEGPATVTPDASETAGKGCVGPDCVAPCDGCDGEASVAPRTVPPAVGAKQCVRCPLPSLPPGFLAAVGRASLLARVCVDTQGAVTRVSILSGLTPALDAQAVDTLQTWRFSPATLDGRSVPFCYATRFVFSQDR